MSTTFSLDDIRFAVNQGADLVQEGLDLGDRDSDLINLVVNAIVTVAEDPDVDGLDTVIETQYGESPEEVRGWWDW
ncbi:hypothetical protein [Streptomyces sp. STCH 565 A]|uniref:hypothetical protein n=1 Tax=Streptomyces sp. STCH 565 A TaxID=2950532 RepID=UPI0006B89FCA|nr:hypothetical protein [Streptomyces sp. STCH 565 A]KPC89288.1 hypothetical protein ADL35_02285 [Streptomyces sp. NRRL WC-3753]MCM8548844.1 hypothetical protein [Streptomyces sp. STCH 565 A]